MSQFGRLLLAAFSNVSRTAMRVSRRAFIDPAACRFTVNFDIDLFTMPIVLLDRASSSPRRRSDMLTQLKRFLKNESGAAAVEYGLLTSGISLAIIPSVKGVGTELVHIFTILQNAV